MRLTTRLSNGAPGILTATRRTRRRAARGHYAILLAALTVSLAACSGPAPPVIEPEIPVVTEPVVHADYESYDVSADPDRPMRSETTFSHDVPLELMEGRAAEGVERTVEGYRVQVLATLDPAEASAMENRVRNWWASQEYRLTASSNLKREQEVYSFFRQPYYRVRIGDFTSREAAGELLDMLAGRYRGAFIVPDEVTVRD